MTRPAQWAGLFSYVPKRPDRPYLSGEQRQGKINVVDGHFHSGAGKNFSFITDRPYVLTIRLDCASI